MSRRYAFLPMFLLLVYLVEFSVLAIRPYSRNVWIVENAPIVLIVAFLVITHRWFRFSNLAYLLMSALIFLHTIGGHYTFERVPFNYVTKLIGAQRNHYDRLAHFTVGFYAYAVAEFIERRQLSRARWLTGLFAVFAIGTVALGYEVFEWLYAVKADPAAGIAVLGSQGDPWDAQKDMLSDILGAIVATLVYFAVHRSAPLSGSSTGTTHHDPGRPRMHANWRERHGRSSVHTAFCTSFLSRRPSWSLSTNERRPAPLSFPE